VHGRMIRPPVAGALPVAVDDGSVRFRPPQNPPETPQKGRESP
jgi:hypothetical protein